MKRTCNNKNCFCHEMEEASKLFPQNLMVEVYVPKSHWDAFNSGNYEHVSIKNWQCQSCGEAIGYIGRFWQFIGLKFHKC